MKSYCDYDNLLPFLQESKFEFYIVFNPDN